MMNTAPIHLVALGQFGVEGLGLSLGHKRVSHAADGAGEAGTLAGLEQHSQNHSQAAQHKQNGHDDGENFHEKYLQVVDGSAPKRTKFIFASIHDTISPSGMQEEIH